MIAPQHNPSDGLTLHSPAKVNLFLSVHGKRTDGFHALTSLVVPVGFGDGLTVRIGADEDSLQCDVPSVPTGPENLILKAAAAFRARIGASVYFHFDLEKKIPIGAGLGGGSSNAAVALKAMNALQGQPFEDAELSAIAAGIGSDCPFFVAARPALMRGRGEIIEPLSERLEARLRGQRLVLFRPHFGVETGWAYGHLAAAGAGAYQDPEEAARRLDAWSEGGNLAELLFNSFERPVGEKYLAISALLEQLRERGISCLMSGSGSCCFALLEGTGAVDDALFETVRSAWGDSVFWVETSIG